MNDLASLSDEVLLFRIEDAENLLVRLRAEKRRRREERLAAAIAEVPFKVGDWVTTKMSRENFLVLKVNPKSLILRCSWNWNGERFALHRILPADPDKRNYDGKERFRGYYGYEDGYDPRGY